MSQSKYVFSLTTSPTRITQMGPTLTSLLAQQPDQVIINIPPTFKRTGETYGDHVESLYADLANSHLIRWNRVSDDFGPITKLHGALFLYKPTDNVWIITVDDDIRYLPQTLNFYKLLTNNGGHTNKAYGLSGLNLINTPAGLKIAVGPIGSEVNVLEGYGSVCYHRSQFPDRSWNSYLTKCFENVPCFCSDDLIISNWLALNKVVRQMVGTNGVNIRRMWQEGCILDHGNGPDALHNGAGGSDNNVNRYRKVVAYLQSVRLLAINVINAINR
jgi:hypothetical protein